MSNEEWITMREAANRMKVAPSKISRLAAKGKIQTKDDPVDERVRLVEYNEVYRLLASSIRFKG